MRKFRNDEARIGMPKSNTLVEQGRDQQVKKHRPEPQVDDDIEHQQLAPLGIAARAEREKNKKRQRGEQDDNEVHRLMRFRRAARRRDRRHVDQAAHGGAGRHYVRRQVAAEQYRPDGNPVGARFDQVHPDVRGVEIGHYQ